MPSRAIARSNQRRLKPVAHSTACNASLVAPFSQQLLDAGFAEHLAKASQISRIARQPRLEVFLAAEVLKVHVLRPALAYRLVALIERVLQVEQPEHAANRQPRSARCAHARAGKLCCLLAPM